MRFLAYCFCLATVLTLAAPLVRADTTCGSAQGRTFLGLPSWDRGLGDCTQIAGDDLLEANETNPAIIITTNVTSIFTQIAGMVAAVFVVVGGFRYVLSDGQPEAANAARRTIINALVGLLIAAVGKTIAEVVFQIVSQA